MRTLPVIEAEQFQVPDRFVSTLTEYCAAEHDRARALGVGVPFESEDGQEVLALAVAAYWPSLFELARLVRDMVGLDPGCVVLRGLGFNRYPRHVRDSLVLALTAAIGKPTDHNADKRVLWPVSPRDMGSNYRTTFSEEAGEAPLHSDSAFAPDPEKFGCLYVVREAEDGGGLSVLVNVRRVVADLATTEAGRECLTILRDREFPFWVPDAFFKDERIVLAPILGERPLIRFRYDSLMNGFELRSDLRTNERLWAIEHFRVAAGECQTRITFALRRGEALIFDNHNLLHARTNFTDPDRLLIRVRMHALAA